MGKEGSNQNYVAFGVNRIRAVNLQANLREVMATIRVAGCGI